MSVHYCSAAWRLQLEPTAKLVMLALADWANDEGVCWPSVAALTGRAGVSDRTVQRTLRGLEAEGYIAVHEGRGRGKSSLYRLTEKVTQASPITPIKGDICAEKGDICDTEKVTSVQKKVTPVSPGSVKDPSIGSVKDPVVRAAPPRALTEPVLEEIRTEYAGRLPGLDGDIAYWLNHIGFQTARDKPAFLRRKLGEAAERQRQRRGNGARASPGSDEYDIDAFLARQEAQGRAKGGEAV